MRFVIFCGLVFSLCGLTYEAGLHYWPELMGQSVEANLVDIDPTTRIARFDLPEHINAWPLYLHAADSSEASTHNDHLLVEFNGLESSFLLVPGETVVIADQTFVVQSVRPWVGVLPDPEGQPYLSLSLAHDGDDWIENLIIGTSGETSVGQYHLNLEMLNETTPEDFITAQQDTPRARRWGVLDGDRMQWFDSLDPGSGLETNDGTAYTLLQFRENYDSPDGILPAIAVRVTKDDHSENRIITTHTTESPIKLDMPPSHQIWFLVSPGNSITAVAKYPEDTILYRPLAMGETWTLDNSEMSLRLEQFASSGLPVTIDQTPFQEAVLKNEQNRLRVRQGEALRFDDALIRYDREIDKGKMTFHISEDYGMDGTVALYPHTSISLELTSGRYSIRHDDIDIDHRIILYPVHLWSRFEVFILAAPGALALVVLALRALALSSRRSNSL